MMPKFYFLSTGIIDLQYFYSQGTKAKNLEYYVIHIIIHIYRMEFGNQNNNTYILNITSRFDEICDETTCHTLGVVPQLLEEVYLPYDLSCPSVGRLYGQSVDRSVIIYLKGAKLHFHGPIGALVNDIFQLSYNSLKLPR